MLKGDTELLEVVVSGEPGEEIPVRVGFMGDMEVDAVPSGGWFYECEVNGEIYSVAGGQVSRFFIGRTPGYFNADLTVEDVRDNLGQIRAEEGYTVPHGISEELGLLLEVFKNNA